MKQFLLRSYTRAELETIFHTSRIDSIKRSLKRAGYKFETGGRGKDSWIRIVALPEPPTPFETFAKREFNCGPQTNFQAMEAHLFLLFYHPEYQFLPSNHQAKYLEDNYRITVSDQSLRNWQNLLIKKNWIAKDTDKVRYCLCRNGEPPREIAEEEYKKSLAQILCPYRRGSRAQFCSAPSLCRKWRNASKAGWFY